jgi:Arc/MetJ-type ribon-helix-helix transcriptional regulator
MTTISLELPDTIGRFVEEQAAKEGFDGAGEYIRSMLRDLLMRKAKEELDAALLEGLDSPSRELHVREWEDMRREATERLTGRAAL